MTAPAHDPRKSNYIATLDGWRGIAIFCVLFCHSLHFYGPYELVAPPLRPLNYVLARLGTFGVSLFFAISGYLICTLLLVEREKSGSISLRSFYIRRAFRILPPAFTFLIGLALLSAFGLIRLHYGELASAAFLYSNYWPDKSWFTTHFWSLSLEEHFYLIWPSLLAFLGNTRATICAAIVVCAMAIVRPLILAKVSLDDVPRLMEKTHMRLDSFMVACLVAILLRHPPLRQRFISVFRTPVWFSLAALLTVIVVTADKLGRHFIDARSIQAALLAIMVAATTLRPTDMIGRILELRPLKFVGRISYSIYLWQQLILQPVSTPNLALNLLHMLIKVAIVIGLAMLSYTFVEQPLIRLGRRLAEETPRPIPATSLAD
jgi:peptidoglycan/LPS O-acetylase OafA/YrhL